MNEPRQGFGLDIEFTDRLRIATTSSYSHLTELHTPNITVTIYTVYTVYIYCIYTVYKVFCLH
jgi:hypothetical protein